MNCSDIKGGLDSLPQNIGICPFFIMVLKIMHGMNWIIVDVYYYGRVKLPKYYQLLILLMNGIVFLLC